MTTQANQKAPGRNDPCPCGSGKKYKKCCGALDAVPVEPRSTPSVNDAMGLFQQGRYREATDICLQVLGQNGNDSAANNLYGLLQYRQGNVQQAVKHLVIALNGDPDNALIHSNLCHMSELLGESEAAKKYCERAIELNPKLADAYNNLGNILINNDDLVEDALEQYRKAVELAPKNPNFVMNVASVLHKKGDITEAEENYRKATRLAPQWPEPLKNLGAMESARGNYVQAIDHLKKALSLDSRDQDTLLSLSLVSKQAGDVQEAEKFLLEIERINPGQTQTQLELASLYQKFGWLDKMEQACVQASKLEPENPKVFETWAKYEEGRHRLDRAEELLGQAETLGLPPHNLLRARIARRQKNWEQARQEMLEIDLDSLEGEDQYKYFYDKGSVLDKLGEYDAAWAAFSEGAEKRIQLDNVNYKSSEQKTYIDRLSTYFTKERLAHLGEIARNQELPGEGAKPIFIVGFPRSGTTLLEQILCSHPNISAGDELPYIREIGAMFCVGVNDNKTWPECLDALSEADLKNKLNEMRRFYLDQVSKLQVVDMEGHYFTDKMPLNLVSIPLIHLLFPDSPIVHIVRNPVDACVSNYFSCFGSSNQHALNIKDAAEYFRMTYEFANTIRERNNGLKYLQIRYEDLVADTESNIRKVIEFIGEPWDDACLNYQSTKRVSRTISYDQVTQSIYQSSVERYRHYNKYLVEAIKILRPIMDELDYSMN